MDTVHSCHIYISGMTCVQCQNKIEAALSAVNGISEVKVSYKKSDASFVYDSTRTAYRDIVKIIRDLGYDVSLKPQNAPFGRLIISIGVSAVLFIALERLGLLNMLAPSRLADSGMSYGALFIVGLLTSVHCIAMCGGINLSVSINRPKNQKASYGSALFYNAGRVTSYTLIGLLLGALGYFIGGGSEIGISLVFQGFIKIIAGILLTVMGAQMLGIFPRLPRLSLPLPKSAAAAAKKTAVKSKAPFIIGLLNGIMPCGPMQSMWIIALASGHPVKGAASMLLFSLGTVPLMLGFGAFVTALGKRFTAAVQNIGAVIVTVMGLSMLSQGGSISGMLSDKTLYVILVAAAVFAICLALPFKRSTVKYGASFAAAALALAVSAQLLNFGAMNVNTSDTAKIANGIQAVSSVLKPGAYPEITVRNGVPVKWTIRADAGSINGCNQSMLSNDFDFNYTFHEGENTIEFIPEQTGDFTYTCWMGMIKGNIHVVD